VALMAMTADTANAYRDREVTWGDDRPATYPGEARGGVGTVIDVTARRVAIRCFDNYANRFAVVNVPLEHVSLSPLQPAQR
jgi:hypothetical protein